MGAMQNNKKEKGSRRKSKQDKTEIRADWEKVRAENFSYLVQLVTGFDGAIRFGRTRDGTKYTIGIYGDGKPYTEYLEGSEDVNNWIAELLDDFS